MEIPKWRAPAGTAFSPAATELNADESLNIPATQKLMERLIQAGVHGFIMLGTVGENCSLRADEKRKVLSAAKEVVNGRIPILSGSSPNSPPPRPRNMPRTPPRSASTG